MDTLKDMQKLRTLHESGRPPWALWLTPQATGPSMGDQLGVTAGPGGRP